MFPKIKRLTQSVFLYLYFFLSYKCFVLIVDKVISSCYVHVLITYSLFFDYALEIAFLRFLLIHGLIERLRQPHSREKN